MMKYAYRIAFSLVLAALTNVSVHAQSGSGLCITNPRDGSVAPANWLYPAIEWTDDAPSGTRYQVELQSGSDTHRVPVDARYYSPDPAVSRRFLGLKTVRIKVSRTGAEASVSFSTNGPPFTDSFVYRLVEPLFNPAQDGIIRTLRLDESSSREMIQVEGTCMGCHAFGNGKALVNARVGLDRRLFIALSDGTGPVSVSFSSEVPGEFSFLGAQDATKPTALCIGTKSFIRTRKTPHQPFDMVYVSGDIAFIDPSVSGQVPPPRPIPGASSPSLVEDMPSVSPDGRTLVFVAYTPPLEPFNVERMTLQSLRLDVPGAVPAPLLKEAPSDWCYFPNWSPDGKWISFVAGYARQGCFARDSSDIWLLSAIDGRMRLLESNDGQGMDSWHAWSSDSRWIAFSSKRDPGGLTALYLAHVDEAGKAYPPIMLARDERLKVNLPFIVPADRPLDWGKAFGAFIKNSFAP